MIRKAAFLVTGTVTGLVAVLSYNPPELNNAIAAPSANPTPDNPIQPTKSAAANPTPTSKSKSANSPVKKSKATTKNASNNSGSADATVTPTQSPSEKASVGVSGTFLGDTAQTRWGPVQVQIVMTDGKITDVSTIQYPNGDRKSEKISSQVIPWLQQETLQVQSANISGISGATYTSTGFKSSLASALQKAGL